MTQCEFKTGNVFSMVTLSTYNKHVIRNTEKLIWNYLGWATFQSMHLFHKNVNRAQMLAQWEPLPRKYKALGLSADPQHKQIKLLWTTAYYRIHQVDSIYLVISTQDSFPQQPVSLRQAESIWPVLFCPVPSVSCSLSSFYEQLNWWQCSMPRFLLGWI